MHRTGYAIYEAMKSAIDAAFGDRRGVTALEYALIASALATVVLIAFRSYFGRIATLLTSITF